MSPDRRPNSRIAALSRRWTHLREAELVEDRRTGWTLILIGVLTFVLLCGRLLSTYDDPSDDDQIAFLNTATTVHDAGGIPQLLRDLYGGRFREANRHPLYIGLLSIHPTLAFGRGLSAFLGLCTLGLLTWMTARRQSLLTAGLLCILLATNMAFCRFSTRVVCDVLMILWGGVIYYVAARDDSCSATRLSVLIGGLLGLAYLTKGTGLLLLVGVVIWKCTRHAISRLRYANGERELDRPTHQITRSLVLIVATWLIVASPLLIRNARLYGSPLYNVNTWLLFVDEFEQPVELSERLTVGNAAQVYWQTHTITEIVQREATGLAWEIFILVRMLGPAPLDDGRAVFGMMLCVCAIIAVIAAPRPEHLLLALWGLLLVAMFAWYVPIAAGGRFLFPLMAPLLMCTSTGIVRLASLSNTPRSRLIVGFASVYCAVVLVWSFGTNWLVEQV